MGNDTITFRAATDTDVDLVFAWANDPVTRAASFNSDTIDYAGHVTWFQASMTRSDRHLMLAVVDGQDAAVLRFDGAQQAATISINVGPNHRGRGLGSAVLAAASAEARRLGYTSILAQIRPDNAASIRAFQKAGYVADGEGIAAGQRALHWMKTL